MFFFYDLAQGTLSPSPYKRDSVQRVCGGVTLITQGAKGGGCGVGVGGGVRRGKLIDQCQLLNTCGRVYNSVS